MDRMFVFPLAAATMKGVDDSLDHVACSECGSCLVAVLLSSGEGLCAACAAIRFRIPLVEPVALKAEIEARLGNIAA
jgi:hypothetical protein